MSDGEGAGGAMEGLNRQKRTEKGDRKDDKREKTDRKDEGWKQPVRDTLKAADKALDPIGPQLKQAEAVTGNVARGMEAIAEKTRVADVARRVVDKAVETAIGRAGTDSIKGPDKKVEGEIKPEAGKKTEGEKKPEDHAAKSAEKQREREASRKAVLGRRRR